MQFVFISTLLSIFGSLVLGQQRPNFLIITIDDLNDYVGCLDGHPNADTPHLDRLAKQGVLFTNAHCSSPVCNPSRAAIWTGLRPTTTGIVSNRSGWFRSKPEFKDVITLPQALEARGYLTAGFGKLFHRGHGNKPTNEWQQFSWYSYGPYEDPKLNYPQGDKLTDWGSPAGKTSYDPEIAQRTILKLGDDYSSPFLLGCGFFRPHTPLYADQKWFDKHPLDSIQLPPGYSASDMEDLVYFGVRERNEEEIEAPSLFNQEYAEKEGKWKAILQAYLASTSAMDEQLGRVIDALAESKHSENTYILCFSDHGWNLGEKRHWGKAALWEQTTRVPFIVVGPGIPQGVVCDKPIELLDVYPTVMDYAGIEPSHPLEGNSLRPLLENTNAQWDRPALITFANHHALRTQRWRYIRYASGEEELYDMTNDPHEFSNLAVSSRKDPMIQKQLEKLRIQLSDTIKQ